MANAIPALQKAIRVMEALANGGEGTSLGLAQRLGISQSTCYRILRTLEAAAWIRMNAHGRYEFSLGLRPFVKPLLDIELGVAALAPDMEALSQATGLTVKLSIQQGCEQVTIARVEPRRPMSVTSPVGARYPVVLGASGACLLSKASAEALARVIGHASREKLWGHESPAQLRARIAVCRREGWCENLGTHPQGIDTLSAPLSTSTRLYALTLIGLRGDLAGKRYADSRRRLAAVAAAASTKLLDDPGT